MVLPEKPSEEENAGLPSELQTSQVSERNFLQVSNIMSLIGIKSMILKEKL